MKHLLTIIISLVLLVATHTRVTAAHPVSKSTQTSIAPEVKIALAEASVETKKGHKIVLVNKENKFVFTKTILKQMTSSSAGQGWSIAAFCCALLGLIFAAIPMGILAVIFGSIGVKKNLKGLAIAGITIGIIDILLGLIIVAAVASSTV